MVVEDGEIFIKCVDPFEDIFEVSKELIGSQKLELTDVLEPSLFESHK